MAYKSVYPVAQNDTYVKSTTKYSTDYWPYYVTDPTKSLTGTGAGNSWISQNSVKINQRLHIDLGLTQVVKRIYYENCHDSGTISNAGVKNFILQGSNTAAAFADLTYATDTNWTTIATATSLFEQHAAADTADPKYILVTNGVGYRYYAFKFADNWGQTDIMGVRRIGLQIIPSGGAFLLLIT